MSWTKVLALASITGLVAGATLIVGGNPGDSTSSGGHQAGVIKVHGHWRIEVRDPDGTSVKVREFENALAAQGGEAIGKFLARTASPGLWGIYLGGGIADPCRSSGGGESGCLITEAAFQGTDANIFKNLVLTASATAPQLTLSGSAVAGFDGTVAQVHSNLQTCAFGEAAPCADTLTVFATRVLGAPISVMAGQQVVVSVKYMLQ